MATPRECNDYTLVRLYDYEKDKMIRSYYVTNPIVVLQQYKWMWDNDVDVHITVDYDDREDPYDDTYGMIEDIEVTFGGNTMVLRLTQF